MAANNATKSDRAAAPRIWIALDESPRSRAALAAAAVLAQELDAELAGLFIEDLDLQHLIGLPFAREFSALTGTARPLSQGDVERAWRHEAQFLRRRLAEMADRQHLRWSFQVARGRVSAEVTARAHALDLIVLGARTGALTVTYAVERPTAGRAQAGEGPVLILFEPESTSTAALRMGAMLARRTRSEAVLMVHAPDEDAYRLGCAAGRAAMEALGSDSRCVWLRAFDSVNLIAAVHREGARCLMLADRARFLGQASFERVAEAIGCPVVLAG